MSNRVLKKSNIRININCSNIFSYIAILLHIEQFTISNKKSRTPVWCYFLFPGPIMKNVKTVYFGGSPQALEDNTEKKQADKGKTWPKYQFPRWWQRSSPPKALLRIQPPSIIVILLKIYHICRRQLTLLRWPGHELGGERNEKSAHAPAISIWPLARWQDGRKN